MSAIIVALPRPDDARKIRKILIDHGFSDVFAVSTGAAALREISRHGHGLLISACRLKDMYYLELQDCLPEDYELILIGSAASIREADSGILSLTTPLKIYDLVNTVGMVLRQMGRRLKNEKKPRKRTEAEENYIRNAKFLLMERNNLTEEEAHRYIQKCSMDNSTNMVETAQMILTLLFEEC